MLVKLPGASLDMNWFLMTLSTLTATMLLITPAKADIFQIFRDIQSTIRSARTVMQEIGYTTEEAKALGESLGIDLDNVDSSGSESGSDLAASIYKEWVKTLSASDKAVIQQLTLEYAAGRVTSMEEVMITGWYQSLTQEQQPRVIGLFAKFNQILEMVDDKNVFLASVFLPEE